MTTVRHVIGVVLIAIGVLVAVHTIFEPLYHVSSEASPYSPVWGFINPLSALAVVLGVSYGYLRKRGVDQEGGNAPVSREYLAANALFYGFLFVGILFFWNWFNLLNPGFTAVGAEAVSLVWAIVDAALPLLACAMGLSLLKGEG